MRPSWGFETKGTTEIGKNVVDVNTAGSGMHVCGEKQNANVMFFLVPRRTTMILVKSFSLPRIHPVASKGGLKWCDSINLRHGWGFTKEKIDKLAGTWLAKKKPRVLTICPPYGPFSPLQHLSTGKGDPQERKRRLVEGRVLLAFAMELCELQMELGNIFLFEHPLGADSWFEECVQKDKSRQGVHEIILDQCMFGRRDPQSKKLSETHSFAD